ncbi:MAG: 23S rRNA (adenine(2503)-C(2))-methyltransferase RlmN [Thermomicrobiales bacterium]
MTTTPRLRQADPQGRRRRLPDSWYDLTTEEVSARFAELGEQPYRARQAEQWTWKQLASAFGEMRTLPASLRAKLADLLDFDPLAVEQVYEADNGETLKMLSRTRDGLLVETVLMFYPDRVTVCVSCQVGCAVGCAFCATGIGGLERNLTSGEMVSQVIDASRRARDRGRSLTNLVMMGMGEPLQNYAETLTFIQAINDPDRHAFGARRITISTSGIVPGIEKLAEEPLQVNLAVSLHAPSNELRDTLVPINTRWPVETLIAAIDAYIRKTGRRVSIEYALMKGINSDDAIAHELAALLKKRHCHVNIIPFNPVDLLPFERPEPADIDRFAQILTDAGIPATVRYSRGLEIAAACGQLRARHTGVL